MLRRRRTLALAGVMAVISAFGLGAGLVGIAPILETLLKDEPGALAHQAQEMAGRIGVTLPAELLESLPSDPLMSIVWTLAFLCALAVIGATANFLHLYFALTVTVWTIADLRRDVFRHVLHMPFLTARAGASEAISRMVADADLLSRGFNSVTSKAVAQITKGAFALLAAFFINWKLTLVAIVVAPIVYTVIRKLGKRIRRASRGMMRARARLLGVASEAVQGVRVVKSLGAESEMLGRFSRHNNATATEQLRARTAKALGTPITELIAVFTLAGLAVLAAQQILSDNMSPSGFIAALAALGVAGASLKPLSSIVQEIQTSEAAAARLCELLDMDLEPTFGVDGRTRLPAPPRHRQSIAFEHVGFTYPGAGEAALQEVTLTIKHGQTVAFVGPNGSGKTTLLSLVPRLIEPSAGRVLLDGVDLHEVDLRRLRRQIGFVSQDVVLFDGTIRENIAMGNVAPSDDRVRAAAAKARALEFIESKSGGLDAHIGEGGVALSGGQRQRLAIARAILRDPAILIMDEATSMIDAESERQISEAITEFSRGRTSLVIAHRLSTVVNADVIVVLDGGRLVDLGRHEELLGRCDVYRRIASGQLVAAEV